MHKNRRKGDRYYLNLDLQADGELLLYVGERMHQVWKLVDISPFGAGLSVAESINVGSKVTLQYRREQFDINVSGVVLWSEPENSQEVGGGFRMGVHFHRNKMPMNTALFKALTEKYHLRQTTPTAHEANPRIAARA
ncbi:PilZ domain-containing protein [Mariprofundus ferrooxydans]|uniref:PilZ domain-containing protein n=1 Tax=Mariprofundus ferrooxydans TaxID=314344 RepID=UPI000377E883|nr:PilZ domain-containing protein [Mariprofundus ferrooxydans]